MCLQWSLLLGACGGAAAAAAPSSRPASACPGPPLQHASAQPAIALRLWICGHQPDGSGVLLPRV